MRRGRPRHPELLTPREQEVLSLIREGLTNEQIALHLGISESGARYHVSEILSKLGVSSRVEAARWRSYRESKLPVLALLAQRMQGATTTTAMRSVGAVAILGSVAVVLLAIGSVLLTERAESPRAVPTPDAHSALADASGIEELRVLADEALNAALNQAPDVVVMEPGMSESGPDDDLMLFQIAWNPASGRYTFRFTEKTPRRWFLVQGPNANPERWHVIRQDIPNLDQSQPAYVALDLNGLRWSPDAIHQAFESHTGVRSREIFLDPIRQGSSPPAIQWVGFADQPGGVLRCEIADSASLTDPLPVRCSGPVAPPPTARP